MSNRTLQDIDDGRRVWFSRARPGDASFAATMTEPGLDVIFQGYEFSSRSATLHTMTR